MKTRMKMTLMTYRDWLFVLVLLANTYQANAQGVPSAVSILPSQTARIDGDIESDRYEKRQTARPTRRQIPEPEKKQPPLVVQPDPEISKPLEQASALEQYTPVTPEYEKSQEAPVGEQFRDLFVGGSQEEIERYVSLLSPDDVRRNRVELELAPMFVYNESKSEYYFRDYITATPAGRVGLSVWFTPFFAVTSSFTKTFLGTVKKDLSSGSQVPFLDQWLQLGFKFRRFSGYGPLASSLSIGVEFFDYQKKVPLDEADKNRLSTSGLMLSAESRLPSTEDSAWLLGVYFMPMAQHKERPTVTGVSSGPRADTYQLGFSVGPELKMNRKHRVFIKSKVVYEKNAFNGMASTSDPRNGNLPENVSVGNTFYFLEVGYTWGN